MVSLWDSCPCLRCLHLPNIISKVQLSCCALRSRPLFSITEHWYCLWYWRCIVLVLKQPIICNNYSFSLYSVLDNANCFPWRKVSFCVQTRFPLVKTLPGDFSSTPVFSCSYPICMRMLRVAVAVITCNCFVQASLYQNQTCYKSEHLICRSQRWHSVLLMTLSMLVSPTANLSRWIALMFHIQMDRYAFLLFEKSCMWLKHRVWLGLQAHVALYSKFQRCAVLLCFI